MGDITQASEFIIAHGCNAQGVMGSGVAKAIRKAYPKAYADYLHKYETDGLKLGDIVWSYTHNKPDLPAEFLPTRLIANCITQQHYGKDRKVYVNYEAIQTCMRQIDFINRAWYDSIQKVAMPKIGAGLGGGDWSVISKIIEEEITSTEPVIYVLTKDEIPNTE